MWITFPLHKIIFDKPSLTFVMILRSQYGILVVQLHAITYTTSIEDNF